MGLVTFYYSDYNHYIGVTDMVVTFCGHSQVANSEAVMEWLRAAAQELIEQGGTTFYLGGYGEFDNLAASVLREIKKLYPQIELILVLPYLNAPKDAMIPSLLLSSLLLPLFLSPFCTYKSIFQIQPRKLPFPPHLHRQR